MVILQTARRASQHSLPLYSSSRTFIGEERALRRDPRDSQRHTQEPDGCLRPRGSGTAASQREATLVLSDADRSSRRPSPASLHSRAENNPRPKWEPYPSESSPPIGSSKRTSTGNPRSIGGAGPERLVRTKCRRCNNAGNSRTSRTRTSVGVGRPRDWHSETTCPSMVLRPCFFKYRGGTKGVTERHTLAGPINARRRSPYGP